ncbi:MAG: hypothetical protein IKB71_08650 [Lentisphaeria bacterium]|nr:hypothetical protein [Lentisphaeria bacterium]
MKKAAKITLWIVGGIFFILLLSAAVFAFLFVSKDPEFVPAQLTDMDYFTGAKISQQVLYRTLKSKKSSELRSIKISNKEMASLMNLAENGESLLYLITGKKPKFQQERNENYKISYNGGIYDFKLKLTDDWCKLCFVASGKAKIRYSSGRTEIDFLSLKVGRTELPQKIQQKIKEYIYRQLKNDSIYDAVRVAVLKVEYASNGDVKVFYYPYRLRKYFRNNVF